MLGNSVRGFVSKKDCFELVIMCLAANDVRVKADNAVKKDIVNSNATNSDEVDELS